MCDTCGKDLGLIETDKEDQDGIISHGKCGVCKEKFVNGELAEHKLEKANQGIKRGSQVGSAETFGEDPDENTGEGTKSQNKG